MQISHSQQRHDIAGQIADSTNGKGMEMVNVGIKELNLWTCTDMNGRFLFRNVPEGGTPFRPAAWATKFSLRPFWCL
jgi:hypothetical protein